MTGERTHGDIDIKCPKCAERVLVLSRHCGEHDLVMLKCGACGNIEIGSTSIRDVAQQLAQRGSK